jgi:hypothetical protein
MTQTTFYIECENCEGEGGTFAHCCSGFDDGVQSCGCGGGGAFEECAHCKDGKIEHDTITWDFATLEDEERHDHETIYSIIGKGDKHGETYIGSAVYTHGEFTEIVDVELQ